MKNLEKLELNKEYRVLSGELSSVTSVSYHIDDALKDSVSSELILDVLNRGSSNPYYTARIEETKWMGITTYYLILSRHVSVGARSIVSIDRIAEIHQKDFNIINASVIDGTDNSSVVNGVCSIISSKLPMKLVLKERG